MKHGKPMYHVNNSWLGFKDYRSSDMGSFILLREIVVPCISGVISSWIDFLSSVELRETKIVVYAKIRRHGKLQLNNIQYNRVFNQCVKLINKWERKVGNLGGYRWPPTFSDWLKTVFWQFWQLTIFSRFNFWGHFEGLNEGFLRSRCSMIDKGMIEPPKWISSTIPFQRAITRLKRRLYAKVTTPGSWCTNLPKRGPHDF